ncbi:hypothetical protein [Amycolatopsis sp. NPDC051903]|uniref:hypothetical protein n=1 Tax=Amycolatopsis sp. NPDC051903 TaxID=3363936 RepID=UPI00379CCF4B
MVSWKVLAGAAGAAALVAAGTIGFTAASANPAPAAALPPKGARAVVRVSPNPATAHGQEITITGNCGGGTGLKTVVGGLPGHPALADLTIVDPNPAHYRATARVSDRIGNGVGPVFVDCGGEAGVTLLVTHP